MEDHRNVAPANRAEFSLRQCEQILPLKERSAAINPPRWTRHQAQHGVAGNGFTRAALANDGGDLTLLDREAHVVHGFVGAVAGYKADGEVVDVE